MCHQHNINKPEVVSLQNKSLNRKVKLNSPNCDVMLILMFPRPSFKCCQVNAETGLVFTLSFIIFLVLVTLHIFYCFYMGSYISKTNNTYIEKLLNWRSVMSKALHTMSFILLSQRQKYSPTKQVFWSMRFGNSYNKTQCNYIRHSP